MHEIAAEASPDVAQKDFFSKEMLAWYHRGHRDLPWRRSKNPYYIWVSEIMLQQTRVDTVIPYFQRFIEQFPTVDALADAPEDKVLKSWEGLGYYSRARNLQTAVREVKEQYGGKVPDDKEQISKLKGVGPYTAGAILSIAYNQPEPAVDGNVMRVLSRYFYICEDITKNSTRALMESLIHTMLPEGHAGDFNQALMELGALVCTPKSPQCLICPVMEHCAGRLAGVEETLPVKKKAKPPRPEYRIVALIEGSGEHAGEIWIRQRPEDGLLARMWELPHYTLPEQEHSDWELPNDLDMQVLASRIKEEVGQRIVPIGWLMNAEHTFSHIQWHMRVYHFKALKCEPGASGTWINQTEMQDYAFPNVFLRILRTFWEEQPGENP